MATEYATCEVWVTVDENGDYSAGDSQDHASEQYIDRVQGLDHVAGLRRVCLTVRVPLPKVIEASVEVVADEADPVVTVK